MDDTTARPAPPAGGADVEQSLYEKRQKIYPREVHGTFALMRVSAVFFLLGIFYGVPWLRWDGHQAVLLDLPARKFYIFGLTLWPQDFLLLTLLLMMGALSLFFFTTLAGRLWCGYACPQTVWTEVYLWMERKIEGNRQQRQRLDKAPWSLNKLRIKATKQAAWIAFALFTGFTFVSYFTPMEALFHKVTTLSLGPWETFWMLFYSFATYGNAGYMREQVCKYMCPYARFQSAMFDNDTLIVSYDEKRGEPRGSRRSGSDPKAQGLGDCINCTLCVQVCPTGIDIRQGLQYECISCSSCIDVCNEVMAKVGYAPGLIRYTTQHALDGERTRIVRPRTIVYSGLLAAVACLFLYVLFSREPLGLDIIRDRNQLYRERGGLIENVYTLKVLNLADEPRRFHVSAAGIDGLEAVGTDAAVQVEGGDVLEVPVVLRARESALGARSNPITFTLSAEDDPAVSVTEDAKFLGPHP
ncbi:MAG: cytochrome c oxidase accessory protein CcoG [Gammaproteobacteria bacterium]|nr:cytochrome c oxidase accessory protein CcoG [Gammaproteobacteria bacterium]